jgi:hypothetical protein
MKYGLLTIDFPKGNLGNRLIEYALKHSLQLGAPTVSVSMFKIPTASEIARLNTCDFVLLPGSTILAKAKRNSDALHILAKIKVPKFCVGASGWGPRFKYYTSAMKHITPPIGCRDPDTLAVCARMGIPAILTGCPTAYLPKRQNKPDVPYTVVGFARDSIDWQMSLLRQVRGKRVAAIQELKFSTPIAKKLRCDVFNYTNPNNVMHHFSEASAVITGRLHGVLPALSQRKPVMFFGHKNDSRFTLLQYLGVHINQIGAAPDIVLQMPKDYENKVDLLHDNFLTWAKTTGIL